MASKFCVDDKLLLIFANQEGDKMIRVADTLVCIRSDYLGNVPTYLKPGWRLLESYCARGLLWLGCICGQFAVV